MNNTDTQRLHDIILSGSDWVWEIDKDWKYTFVDGRIKEILSYSAEELIGKTPFDFMPKEEAKRVEEIFGEIASKKEPIKDLENWNLSKDGKKVCLLTNGVPILGDNGELLGYRGVDKDVTQQRTSEKETLHNQKKYQELFELSTDGILLIDFKSKKIKNANLKSSEILGYDKEELVNLTCTDVLIPDDGSPCLCEDLSDDGGDKSISKTFPLKRKDGSLIHASINASIFFSEGSPSIIAAIRDVTDENKAEEDLKEKIEELERLNKLMVNREMKMIELKEEIGKLKNK